MTAKNKWLIGIGIVLGLALLFFLPSLWQALFPASGYGMVGYGHMPMMYNSGFSPARGWMGFGMSFMWIIPLAVLVLFGLSIAALIKYLRA